MSYEYVPIGTDDKAISEIAVLLRLVFPTTKKYSNAFIKWQYKNNPDGSVLGFNAYHNGVLAGHYAAIPISVRLFGKEEKGLLSLNTATHPDHQGNKLFTSLAQLTYQLASEKGYGFVIGVANASSTHGFVNKLGFQLISALDAKLGWGKIIRPANVNPLQFVKIWNKETVEWKLANPEASYRIKKNIIYSATDKMGIEAILLDSSQFFSLSDNAIDLGFRPFKLWIGIDTSINWRNSFYFNIPIGIRPSPLNFIFKDLTTSDRKLEKNKVQFNAFDFDAY